MANIQSASDLKNLSGLVSFGHPPVDLCFKTAANKTKTTFLELLATYWYPPHTWERPAIMPLDLVFNISELGNAIFDNPRRNDLTKCLEVSRSLRHAVRSSSAAQSRLATLPFEPADGLSDRDTCCIPFPYGLERLMIITKDVVLPSKQGANENIHKQPKHRIFVDIHIRREGHDPHDFDIVGSWADMKLPDMPSSLT
ncbi:unnamed protein product [Aureobasidium vineae]|uniref:Uncharacterized protein n=1 Tax=Aureobasidium vineae TaxID=2773715 RepID=A0A9N8JRA5_9PEZI|nr:unnamed protein product [Aureobasidium vineae]